MRRMLSRRPSPSLVISLIALVFATTGSAVAAVSFARNAGAVDGKSAFLPKTSLDKVAGDVVATTRSGADRGKIPNKFLAGVQRGGADSFGRVSAVTDNGSDVPTTISTLFGLGEVRATCRDQNPRPGIEDPVTDITLATAPGADVNVTTQRGGQPPEVFGQAGATVTSTPISGSNTLDLHVERLGSNFALDIVVRQERAGTADSACLVYGYAQRFTDNAAGA